MEYLDWAGLAALIVSVGALIKAWRGDPGETADAAKIYQELATKAGNRQTKMREDLDALEIRVNFLQDELNEYKRGVEKLIDQLTKIGEEPVWRPKKRR